MSNRFDKETGRGSEPPSPKLTIAIPTYNRNALLGQTLRALAPQLKPWCHLLILDNHSPNPVEPDAAPILRGVACSWQIVRHPLNIGGDPNIMRCFELCRTEWLWILCDDDVLSEKAVEIIEDHLRRFAECVFISFESPHKEHRPRTKTEIVSGLGGLMLSEADLGSLMFAPASLYNFSRAKEFVQIGCRYCLTSAAHLAILFKMLERGAKSCVSNVEVIRTRPQIAVGERYSIFKIVLGLPLLMDIPQDAASRQLIRDSIRDMARRSRVINHVFGQLVRLRLSSPDGQRARYLLWQSWQRYFRMVYGKRSWPVFLFIHLVLCSKLSSRALMRAYELLIRGSRVETLNPIPVDHRV